MCKALCNTMNEISRRNELMRFTPNGRLCCIADVFDALTAERSYKAKLTAFEALKIMKEEMLDHFHKEIFEEFVLLFTSRA